MIFTIGNTELKVKLLEAADTIERLERKAGIKRRSPNAALLDLVSAWIERQCGSECTPTAAWCVWWAIYERLDALRVSTIHHADVANCFHVNPFDMTEEQFTGLAMNIPRAKAQQILRDGKYDSTDWKYCYDLVLLATGDKQAAEKAKSDAAERYVNLRSKGASGNAT